MLCIDCPPLAVQISFTHKRKDIAVHLLIRRVLAATSGKFNFDLYVFLFLNYSNLCFKVTHNLKSSQFFTAHLAQTLGFPSPIL